MNKITAKKLFKELKKDYASVEMGIGNRNYFISVSINDVYCDRLKIDKMLGIASKYKCHLNINGKKVYIEKIKGVE